MDFGITFPSYIRAYHDAKLAEDYGFTHAWFYDSHMCYSDVYASMALAAEHTRHLKIGSLVSILGNRIAPVTAHSVATINELAPGRVILGVGTGFTGRDVTPDALEPLFEKRMDGFSIAFHQLSHQKIGTSTIQSRATAGLTKTTFIFCLPGSPGACKDAWDGILANQLDYRHMPCNFVEIMPRLDEHLKRSASS